MHQTPPEDVPALDLDSILNSIEHGTINFTQEQILGLSIEEHTIPKNILDEIKVILLNLVPENETSTLSDLVDELLNRSNLSNFEFEHYAEDFFGELIEAAFPRLSLNKPVLSQIYQSLANYLTLKISAIEVDPSTKTEILNFFYRELGVSLGLNPSKPLDSSTIYQAIRNLDLIKIATEYNIANAQLKKILSEALYQFEIYEVDEEWKHIPLTFSSGIRNSVDNLRDTNFSIINKLNPYLHGLRISNEAKMAIRRFCRLHPESIDQITSYQLEITEDKEKGTVNIGPNVLVMRTMKQVNYELIDESDLSRAQKSFITLLWEMSITLDLKNIFLNGQNLIKSIHRDEASQSGIGIQKVYETNQPLWQSDFSTSDLYRYINSFNVIENGDTDSVGLLRLKDLILDSSKILTDMYQVDIHTILDLIQNKLKEHN